jgi:hypothetical protein
MLRIKRTGTEGHAMDAERYTPTRLEWMVLSIQSKIPMLLSQLRMLKQQKSVDDIRVFFKFKEPDTIIPVVRHLTGVPREVVKLLNEEIAREIHEIAQYYGWDNWLKIEWDLP